MFCHKCIYFLLINFVYLELSEQRHFLVKTKEETEKPSLRNNQGSLYTSLRPKERGNDYQAYVGDDEEYYYDPEESFPTTTVKIFINFKKGSKMFFFSSYFGCNYSILGFFSI